MNQEDLADVLNRAGTKAVHLYSEISSNAQANEVPETYLSSMMATGIHELLPGYQVHVERPYTRIARDLGRNPDAMQALKIQGLKADIALYHLGTPVALVEVKIFDEGRQPLGIVADLQKDAGIFSGSGLEIYAAVMVCETTDIRLDGRLGAIDQSMQTNLQERAVEPFLAGEKQTCDRWKWCFACARLRTTSNQGMQ